MFTSRRYDRQYYQSHIGSSMSSASIVVRAIVDIYPAVRSVIDVGCGLGAWLEQFGALGVTDFVGVDANPAKSALQIPVDSFRRHDLEQPLRLDRRFDLAL